MTNDPDHEEVMISPFGQEYIHLRATRVYMTGNGIDKILIIKTSTHEYRVFIDLDCEILTNVDPIVGKLQDD